MSKESAQFTEMVRQASARPMRHSGTTTNYCSRCQKYTTHDVDERGTWEYQTCRECGNTQSYRVR